MISALFVAKGGVYFGLDNVDPWDIERDARTYAGPYPVIAHPPCARWGNYWGGGPLFHKTPKQKKLGDDGGCFEAALKAVRRYGGVLEHPANSRAWIWYGLNLPPYGGGWVNADFEGGWTCRVEQGAYGHLARKPTWLYACHVKLPSLKWGRAPGEFLLIDKSDKENIKRISKKQRIETPIPFRDVLIAIARSNYLI